MIGKLMDSQCNGNIRNYPFCSLQLVVGTFGNQLNKPTNQNSVKIPKVVKPTNNKAFGTNAINSPLSHLSLSISKDNNTHKT